MRVAVLGSGITGLSAAYQLHKHGIETVLFESTSRIGGWINTDTSNGQIMETGPRTIRPAGRSGAVTLSIIHQLGLESQLIIKEKGHISAKNRFILYNKQLNKLPSSIIQALFDSPPVFKGIMKAIMREPFVKRTSLEDESIYSFFSRRFNKDIANNLVSAMVHGIYAGNIHQLSIKSTFKSIWDAEQRYGSIIKSFIQSKKADINLSMISSCPHTKDFIRRMMKYSLYSFQNGLSTLTDALYHVLSNSSTTQVRLSSIITDIQFGNQDKRPILSYTLQNRQEIINEKFDHVICTIPSFKVSTFQTLPTKVQSLLAKIPFTNVIVMNFGYSSKHIPIEGFGFLVPSSQNLDILGVILDSCTLPEQDNKLMRFTVMHKDTNQSESQYLANAESILGEFLGLDKKDKVYSTLRNQKQCIAQYIVGHAKVCDEIERYSKNSNVYFRGSSYNGVSINDCVLDGYQTAHDIIKESKN